MRINRIFTWMMTASVVIALGVPASAQTASSISLKSLSNPSNYGQSVTLVATVTSGATGKVTFYDGTTVLGVGTRSGRLRIPFHDPSPSGQQLLTCALLRGLHLFAERFLRSCTNCGGGNIARVSTGC